MMLMQDFSPLLQPTLSHLYHVCTFRTHSLVNHPKSLVDRSTFYKPLDGQEKICQVPCGIFLNESNIWPAAPCMRKGAFAWNTDLIYLFPLCLSFLSGKRGEQEPDLSRRRQFHAFWISQKGVHIFLSLSFCARKMTLLWNGAKFVVCRSRNSKRRYPSVGQAYGAEVE